MAPQTDPHGAAPTPDVIRVVLTHLVALVLLGYALVEQFDWVVWPGMVVVSWISLIVGVSPGWLSPETLMDSVMATVPWIFLILGSLVAWVYGLLVVMYVVHWLLIQALRLRPCDHPPEGC